MVLQRVSASPIVLAKSVATMVAAASVRPVRRQHRSVSTTSARCNASPIAPTMSAVATAAGACAASAPRRLLIALTTNAPPLASPLAPARNVATTAAAKFAASAHWPPPSVRRGFVKWSAYLTVPTRIAGGMAVAASAASVHLNCPFAPTARAVPTPILVRRPASRYSW